MARREVRIPNLGAILVLNLVLNVDASDCPDPREPHPSTRGNVDSTSREEYDDLFSILDHWNLLEAGMPEEGKPAEQRKHPRYEVTAYVDYAGSEVLLYHRIENISMGGICIQTASLEDRGTVVDLVINFPDLDTSLSIQGEVVWANQEHPMDMGIRYINLDEEHRETLRKYIAAVCKK